MYDGACDLALGHSSASDHQIAEVKLEIALEHFPAKMLERVEYAEAATVIGHEPPGDSDRNTGQVTTDDGENGNGSDDAYSVDELGVRYIV